MSRPHNKVAIVLVVALDIAMIPRSWCTAVPPPGPACGSGVPAANQSSPNGPKCPGQLMVHNASCAAEPGRQWQRRAMYHPGSECHGENDPNGVMEYNGIFHLFFQDHNPMQLGGHLATRDFVHYRRLPIAIWNDRWWDKAAIWTFSSTLVNGTPHVIYPGIAGTNLTNGDCGAGLGLRCFTHALALPTDATDSWLEDWYKPGALNPTVQRVNGRGMGGESRDPTTAWQTSQGEWRYTDANADIFSSWDFRKWTWVGNIGNFGKGDCPDFFPLPRDCDGCGRVVGPRPGATARPGAGPSHVRAGGFHGVYALGDYLEQDPNTTGAWRPLPQFDTLSGGEPLPMDLGGPTSYYAAKSFWDSVNKRRLVWAWVRLANQALEALDENGTPYPGFKAGGCPGVGLVMTNTNSMAREVTYDPELQRLNYYPVREMAALRGTVIGSAPAGARVAPQKPLALLTGDGVIQSELQISFAMPTEAVRVGVTLLSGMGDRPTQLPAAFATEIYIDFVPAGTRSVWNATVGVDQSSMSCPNYVRGAPPPSVTNRTACPASSTSLPLKASDTSLDIAVWVDNLFLEVFLMGGRVAWTIPLPCKAITRGAGATAFVRGGEAAVQLLNATVWKMGSITYNNTGGLDNRT